MHQGTASQGHRKEAPCAAHRKSRPNHSSPQSDQSLGGPQFHPGAETRFLPSWGPALRRAVTMGASPCLASVFRLISASPKRLVENGFSR